LPAATSGFSAAIAAKVRPNAATEIDTVVPDEELELALLELPPLGVLEDEELLQAAAPRHKASDADATTAPFLAIGIM
jgi:hypothetical protein